LRRLAVLALAALVPATTAVAQTPARRLVFASRTEAGSTGFIDLASVQEVAGRREALTVLVLPGHPMNGAPSHILARVTVDCGKNQSRGLTLQMFDSDDRPLGDARSLDQDLGPMEPETHDLICGGPDAPVDPRVFPNAAAAAQWAPTRGI
jgi:hypothetical protein